MIVYLLVRRQKQNIFLEADEGDSVYEIKLMLEGILKKAPAAQRLFYLPGEDSMTEESAQVMGDDTKLNEYGINSSQAKAQAPAKLGLAIRNEANQFEVLNITAYSNPPPLPDIMKSAPSADEANNKQ